ncbi:type II toxin-antitoxin system Phd/YefM family antitoxin [Hungatella sp.]|jgi:antitoxin YefM|uniref:type II toxin-antitoxin system Phd/YefM family antitoxin n=1 Tax=Hungatella sp. TaxID=2613924 RepID=UPI002A8043B9|nr:type II toxin-antitoxin system Phd/YefM family antitoxin [Hungatella sp.]
MSTINITNARKDLYNLVENAKLYSEPTLIVGKRGNAVLLSEDDWNAIQETLYLSSIPGMTESIIEGANTPIEDCIPEDKVLW